jgi:hypothetical protein
MKLGQHQVNRGFRAFLKGLSGATGDSILPKKSPRE